jgi:hypothetical protein
MYIRPVPRPTAIPCRPATVAATSPDTYIPAVGAVIVGAGGGDQPISDGATEYTPLFGSPDAAGNASDILLWTSVGATVGSLF